MQGDGEIPDESGMQRAHRAIKRALVGSVLAGVFGAGMTGCAKGEPRTEIEAKIEFAKRIVDGGFIKLTDVTATSYDPVTYELIDVEISDRDRIIRAARAEILISREMDTVSLRLIDVVAADSTPGVEAVVSMESMTTEPVALGYEVID